MIGNTMILNRFEYHSEDLECADCLHYKSHRKTQGLGCKKSSCRYGDIRAETVTNGKIKRKAGYFKWQA